MVQRSKIYKYLPNIFRLEKDRALLKTLPCDLSKARQQQADAVSKIKNEPMHDK
jgi:hypothetical protein